MQNVSLSHGRVYAKGLLPLALHLVTLIGGRPPLTPQDVTRQNIFKGCDYSQKVPIGHTHFIYSHGYDSEKTFPDGIVCRWHAESPEKSRLELNCLDFKVGKMDQSRICTNDRLLVSPTGDPAMTDAETQCGEKNFNMKSVGNKLLLLFFSDHEKNPSDRFLCSLKAVPHKTCDCGRWNKRQIYNGVETDINEFPMMAGVLLPDLRFNCGASIISRRYAITAAHCFPPGIPGFEQYFLLVGGHNSSNYKDPPAVLYGITEILIHPRYKNSAIGDDIALVKVGYTDEDGIQFNEKVGPVCLPFRYHIRSFTGKELILPGWGTAVAMGHPSDVLQKINVRILPLQPCLDAFGGIVTYRQICTYQEGSGPCSGDSGGPLLWLDKTTDRLHILGVLSFSMSCDPAYPFVSTRVASYLNWIAFTTNEEFCIL